MGFLKEALNRIGTAFIGEGKKEAPEASKIPPMPIDRQWKDLHNRIKALGFQKERSTGKEDDARLEAMQKELVEVEARANPEDLAQWKLMEQKKDEQEAARWAAKGN